MKVGVLRRLPKLTPKNKKTIGPIGVALTIVGTVGLMVTMFVGQITYDGSEQQQQCIQSKWTPERGINGAEDLCQIPDAALKIAGWFFWPVIIGFYPAIKWTLGGWKYDVEESTPEYRAAVKQNIAPFKSDAIGECPDCRGATLVTGDGRMHLFWNKGQQFTILWAGCKPWFLEPLTTDEAALNLDLGGA